MKELLRRSERLGNKLTDKLVITPGFALLDLLFETTSTSPFPDQQSFSDYTKEIDPAIDEGRVDVVKAKISRTPIKGKQGQEFLYRVAFETLVGETYFFRVESYGIHQNDERSGLVEASYRSVITAQRDLEKIRNKMLRHDLGESPMPKGELQKIIERNERDLRISIEFNDTYLKPETIEAIDQICRLEENKWKPFEAKGTNYKISVF